jgi:titin
MSASFTQVSAVAGPAALPAAPTNFTVVATSPTSVSATWTDNASNENGNFLDRLVGTNWTHVATTGGGGQNAAESGLTPNTQYQYRVCAYNGAGQACSNYANVTTPQAIVAPTTPAAPSGLAVSSKTTTSLTLAWTDNATNEQSLIVQRWNGSSFIDIKSLAANSTTYSDAGLQPATTYYYDVCAINTAGRSCSAWIPGTTDRPAVTTTPPASPSGLAVASKTTSLTLAWTDNANNEQSLVVQRWNGSSFIDIKSLAANSTTYSDAGLQPATTYYYDVCAINTAGRSCSAWIPGTTDKIAAPVAPVAPASLAVTGHTTASLTLGWTDNSSNEQSFVVLRLSRSSWIDIKTLTANATTYTDTGLQPGTSYIYRVCAVNTAGRSCSAEEPGTTDRLAAPNTVTVVAKAMLTAPGRTQDASCGQAVLEWVGGTRSVDAEARRALFGSWLECDATFQGVPQGAQVKVSFEAHYPAPGSEVVITFAGSLSAQVRRCTASATTCTDNLTPGFWNSVALQ